MHACLRALALYWMRTAHAHAHATRTRTLSRSLCRSPKTCSRPRAEERTGGRPGTSGPDYASSSPMTHERAHVQVYALRRVSDFKPWQSSRRPPVFGAPAEGTPESAASAGPLGAAAAAGLSPQPLGSHLPPAAAARRRCIPPV